MNIKLTAKSDYRPDQIKVKRFKTLGVELDLSVKRAVLVEKYCRRGKSPNVCHP